MHTTTPRPTRVFSAEQDQRIFLRGISWNEYEILTVIRGDRPGVRLTYLEGTLEIMSPSDNHEWIKKTLARLLEAYSDVVGIPFEGLGSWTLKESLEKRGCEPDECYFVSDQKGSRPDLALEVVWTSGGLDKLEVYRGLGVPEVWIWHRDHGLSIHHLEDGGYVQIPRSRFLPHLDLDKLVSYLDWERQYEAARDFRRWLMEQRGEG